MFKPEFPHDVETHNQKRNIQTDSSLEEMQAKLEKAAAFNLEPASVDFQESLKQRLFTERAKKKFSMKRFSLESVYSLFTPKQLISAVAFGLVALVVLSSLYLLPGNQQPGGSGLFSPLSRLIISSAYAQDNFEIEPSKADSIGVEGTTTFIITSKDTVDIDILRESIQIEPATDFELKAIDNHTFEVIPEDQLEGRTIYNVRIDSAFIDENGKTVAREYSWAFQVKDTFKVLNTLPRDKGTAVPTNTGIEITFSHQSVKGFESAFSIEPAVSGRFEAHDRTMVFVPNQPLLPGTIYTVTLDKEKISVDGSDVMLPENYTLQFETASPRNRDRYYSEFRFNSDFNSFTPAQEPFFEVYQYNTEQSGTVSVQVYAFSSPEQFVSELEKTADLPYWSAREVELDINVSRLLDVGSFDLELVTVPAQYRERQYLVLPEALPNGFYFITAKKGDNQTQALFQVTNLSMYTTVTEGDALFWVNDTNTKGPVSNAQVRSLITNQERRTNNDGVALFSLSDMVGAEPEDVRAKTHIQISSGQDIGIYPIETAANFYYYFDAESQADMNDYWSYTYTDRRVYKPNDTVEVWGYLSPRDAAASNKPLKVSIISRSYYNYYLEPTTYVQEVIPHSDGTFHAALQLDQMVPGWYNVEIAYDDEVITYSSLQVEDYRKPSYQISITPEEPVLFAGQEAVFDIQTSFFEGTPVAQVDLSYSTYVDYSGERTGQVTTNDNGRARVSVPTERPVCTVDDSYCANMYSAELNVGPTRSEEGDISGSKSVLVFNSRVDAEHEITANGAGRAELKTTAYNINLDNYLAGYQAYRDGTAARRPVTAIVTQVYYERIETGQTYYDFINKTVRQRYRYNRVETEVGRTSGETNEQGVFTYDFSVEKDKSYYVTVQVGDGAGRNHVERLYYYGSASFINEPSEMDEYQFTFTGDDKNKESKEVRVGDTVDFEFLLNGEKIKEGNGNRFLYFTLQQGLRDYTVTRNPEHQLVFQEEDIPNIYVKGVFFNGVTYYEGQANTGFYWGWFYNGLQVRLDTESKKLEVEITPDKEQYKPGDTATFDIRVTDPNGDGVQADIALHLIDEAVYEIAGNDPYPLESLYRSLPSGEISTFTSHEESAFTDTAMGAEGGGCFLPGTKILMADGTEKNIEDIVEGDMILTYRHPLDKTLVPARVKQTFKHIVSEYWIVNDRLKITPVHRVLLNNGWQMIGEAKPGDTLLDSEGNTVVIETIEPVRELVEVFNFEVEIYHTYIANGIYVHNDKGGVRETFADNVAFEFTQTDRSGRAKVSVELPDNVTSWRVTTQAIETDELMAGHTVSKINVSLPFFVQPTFADEYLVGDVPTIKLRSYGTALTSDIDVAFELISDALGFKSGRINGEAFQPVYISLGELTKEGKFDIRSFAEGPNDDDTVVREISVLSSRLRESTQIHAALTENMDIEGNDQGRTTVTFSDQSQGKLYGSLVGLAWTGGDRVDQKLARIQARELLHKYFEKDWYVSESMDSSLYQVPNSGGISLLPYSSEEAELSAKVAAVASDMFDQTSLANYFYSIVKSESSTQEEVGLAFYGLSALHEPILVPLQRYASIESLSVKEQLYAALALAEIGDKEKAREMYFRVIDQHSEDLTIYARIADGDSQDRALAASALAANLGALLGDPQAERFWEYTQAHSTKDILIKLEQLLYVSHVLPTLHPGEVSFTYTLAGDEKNVTLERGRVYSISVTPEERRALNIKNIQGDISVISTFDIPASEAETQNNESISVRRAYFVNGVETTLFKEDDIVEVRIYPVYGDLAPLGSYQVTDVLPSGMVSFTGRSYRGIDTYRYDCSRRYPFEEVGQQLKFYLYHTEQRYRYCDTGYFTYSARVVNPGSYKAEPVLLQSMDDAELKTYGEFSTVTIQ